MTVVNIPSFSSELIVKERDLLTRVAQGGRLADVLRDIVLLVEEPSNGELLASVLIVSEDRTQLVEGAAPSLPSEYNEAINGIAIGPNVGSCGTAAFTGEPVIVQDIEADPLWTDFRQLALAHGLRACWSVPLKNGDGHVLGTFANYYREPKAPTERDWELINMVARTTAIAVERHRNDLARQRAEEQRVLLLRELNHRVKNVFALANSLIQISARSAQDAQEFAKVIQGRLSALSRAHELVQPGLALDQIEPRDARLEDVIRDILSPYLIDDRDDRIHLSGPGDAKVSAKAITGFALVIHELATNAAKYGALSQAQGQVLVSWTYGDRLIITWNERGGPPPFPRKRAGFGSTLTKKTIESQFHGSIIYDWQPHGLDVTISLPPGALVT